MAEKEIALSKTYRAALVGCSRMGAFIDNEVRVVRPSPLPYSHAAGYEACDRTDLVAGSDLRPEVLEQFGKRYNVPPERQYTDYKQMILEQKPEILSIATQPEHRTEVILFAIEHGVKAIYAEKALCASMDEAEAIRKACQDNGIFLNMGTNRRWHTGFDAMRGIIESGEYGALKTLIIYSNGTLFNTSSHWFDLMMRLNGDVPVSWVQAYLPKGDELIVGDELQEDPASQAAFAFENGVMCHAMLTPRPSDIEAIFEKAVVTAYGGGVDFELRVIKGGERVLEEVPYPDFEVKSSTLCLIQDLVHSLDTGEPPRGGVQIAYDNMQLIFGCVESHRLGGARVALPLVDHKIKFIRRHRKPQQPRYA